MNPASSKFLFILFLFTFAGCSSSVKDSSQSILAADKQDLHTQKDLSGLKMATFSSGCFWCMESVFESVKGVNEAISGYSGGKEKNPTYEQVGSGSTGHAESVQVYYDSTIVDYATLVKVYFASENPTQVDGQGPDEGTQYRSIIFYNNNKEKEIGEKYISELNTSGKLDGPVAAELQPFEKFWKAEDYHQDYIQHNPNNPYVIQESIPRVKRFQSKFPELVKPEKNLVK
jgi:peptide-methionine (S)-S-oxide reductase